MPHANSSRVAIVQSISLAVATVAAFATAAVMFTLILSSNDKAIEAADEPVRISAVIDERAVEPQIVAVMNTNETNEAPATVEPVAATVVERDMEEPTAQRVFADASPAVVAIIVRNADAEVIAQATGFIVSPDGMIVTARSAMKGVHSAAAVLESNAQLPITRVVAQDKVSDLVLLATDGRNLPHLSLSPAGAPAVGSRVYAVAAPPRFDHTIHEALVSGYRTPTDKPAAAARVRLAAEFEPASLGAPLLDSDSRVVGVATEIDKMTHATLATPAMVLTDLLEAAINNDKEPDGPVASLAFADLNDPAPGFSPAPQAEASADDGRPTATLFDGNPASTFAADASRGQAEPIHTPEGADEQQLRDRSAVALEAYKGTELEHEADDAHELGLRLAAIQERLESLGPTLQQLSMQAFEMADAADRISRRNPNTRLGDRALSMKLKGSDDAFVARHAARNRDRLDVQHDYERHITHGGPEGFHTYLRAREVAAIPEGWLRLPAWVGTGKGLSVSPPLRVKRSYAPARYIPPQPIESPGDNAFAPQDAPAQDAPKVLD